MLIDNFEGMHWMLATPFHEDEELDKGSIRSLVEQARKANCTGVVGLGVMGESSRLSDSERTQVAEEIFYAADNLPVTIGTTSDSTKVAIDRSKEAERMGASAVMIAPPPMLKPNLDTLLLFYAKVGDSISIPIILQDYPQISGIHLPVHFIAEVASKVPNIRFIKLEDPPTPTKITGIINLTDDRLGIFGGLGGVFLLDELKRGSIGAMTGFAFPEILVQLCQLVKGGRQREAEQIFYKYLPLIQFEQQEGIGLGIRKAGLEYRGLIKSSMVRHPGSSVSDQTRKELLKLISDLNLDQAISDLY